MTRGIIFLCFAVCIIVAAIMYGCDRTDRAVSPASDVEIVNTISASDGKLIMAWSDRYIRMVPKPADPGPLYIAIIKTDGTFPVRADSLIVYPAISKPLPGGLEYEAIDDFQFYTNVNETDESIEIHVGQLWRHEDVPVFMRVQSIDDDKAIVVYLIASQYFMKAYGAQVSDVQRSLTGGFNLVE